MKKLTVGVVGAGNFFLKRYFEEIQKQKNLRLTCLCRTNRQSLKKIGKITGVKKLYTDINLMLKSEKLDFVLITSPHSKHFNHIKKASEYDVNILVEKPLVVNYDEKSKIEKIINKTKNKIISVYNPPYESHFNELKKIINQKKTGKLKYINIFWSDYKKDLYFKSKFNHKNKDSSKNFRFKKNNSDGSILFDSTCHLIAEMLWITNKLPKKVYAISDKKLKPLMLKMNFSFNKNLKADVYITCNSKFKKRIYSSFYLTNKRKILLKGNPHELKIKDLNKEKVILIKKFKNVSNPINEMVNYLTKNKKPKLDIKQSLQIISILISVEKSFKLNKTVNIKY